MAKFIVLRRHSHVERRSLVPPSWTGLEAAAIFYLGADRGHSLRNTYYPVSLAAAAVVRSSAALAACKGKNCTTGKKKLQTRSRTADQRCLSSLSSANGSEA